MKKNLKALLALTLAAVVILSACAKKKDKEEKKEEVVEIVVDPIDFEFSTSSDSAKITGYTGENPEVIIPAEVISPKDGLPYPVTEIDEGAFFENDFITSVVIPEGVTELGVAAFQNCTALTSVVLPESLESIGTRAFFGCQALTDLTIGKNVNKIGDMVFGEYFVSCPWYENLTGNVIVGDGVLIKYDGVTTSFGEEVKHVGYYSFLDSKTPAVTFSSALLSINDKAFVNSSTVITLDSACEDAIEDAKTAGVKYEIVVSDPIAPESNAEVTE